MVGALAVAPGASWTLTSGRPVRLVCRCSRCQNDTPPLLPVDTNTDSETPCSSCLSTVAFSAWPLASRHLRPQRLAARRCVLSAPDTHTPIARQCDMLHSVTRQRSLTSFSVRACVPLDQLSTCLHDPSSPRDASINRHTRTHRLARTLFGSTVCLLVPLSITLEKDLGNT